MKFPAPPSQRVSRDRLLAGVRAELEARFPRYARILDNPGDPGWMLLEQAAWMAEQLTAELDHHPRATIEYLLSLLGRELRPAIPALGVVSLAAADKGQLEFGAYEPRFFAPITEEREAVEFCLMEQRVPMAVGRVSGLYRLDEDRLLGAHNADKDFPGSQVSFGGDFQELPLLEEEQVLFTIDRSMDPTLKETLEHLLTLVNDPESEASRGWLRLSYEDRGDTVVVVGTVDVALPYPGEGRVRGPRRWERLNQWRPQVVADGTVPGLRVRSGPAGEPILEGCPALPTNKLLRRERPAPRSFPDDLWEYLRTVAGPRRANLPLRPPRTRSARSPEGAPPWVGPLVFEDHWSRIADGAGNLVSLEIERVSRRGLRVAVLFDTDGSQTVAPVIELLGRDGAVQPLRPVWTLPLPRPAGMGAGICLAACYAIPPSRIRRDGYVLLHEDLGIVLGAIFNPALVINAPRAHDGRSLVIEAGPQELDLLWGDLVNTEVVCELQSRFPEEGGREMAHLLSQFQVASLMAARRDGQANHLGNWNGLVMDPSAGRLHLGVPSRWGSAPVTTGQRLTLEWYRRTDGALGNLAAGEVSIVEQPVGAPLVLTGVHNPLACHMGENRESVDEAVQRLFGPERGNIPTIPADLEWHVRNALAPSQADWVVRVWTHAERVLLRGVWWAEQSTENWIRRRAAQARRKLDAEGSSTVLVVLGAPDRVVELSEFLPVAASVRRRIRSIADRLPHIRDCVVVPFHPLSLWPEEDPAQEVELPCFYPGGLVPGMVGSSARSYPLHLMGDLWFDAAVLQIEAAAESTPDSEPGPDAPGFEQLENDDI